MIVCQSEKTKNGVAFDLDGILTSELIRKVKFSEGVLVEKLKLNALPGITIHILPSISRSNGNQAMKFGQLVEYTNEKYFSLNIMQKISQGD